MASIDACTKRSLLAIIWEYHYLGFGKYTSQSRAIFMANDVMYRFESKSANKLRAFIDMLNSKKGILWKNCII